MVKYIFQQNTKKWVVADSKTGKNAKNFLTKKDAIAYVKTLLGVSKIIIQEKNDWVLLPLASKEQEAVNPKTKNSVVDVEEILEITSELAVTQSQNSKPPFKHEHQREYKWAILISLASLFLVVIIIVLISLFLI